MPTASDFYVVGGTMSLEAPSYIERNADVQLYEALLAGDFCYVLTSRQMGKSSLMIRTSARLRAAGLDVVLVDLTAIGQNVSVEQWYAGLMLQVGNRASLEQELVKFWSSQPLLGPMQRWIQGLRSVVLQE